MKNHIQLSLAALSFVLFLFLFSACSVEISQMQIVPTRTPTTPTDTLSPSPAEAAALTEPPTLTPGATQSGDPAFTPALSSASTEGFAFSPVESTGLEIQIMPDYPKDLQGHLLFLSTLEDGLQALVTLAISTGEVSILFVTQSQAWLLSQSVSPDFSQILISYAPPPPEGKPSYGYTDLCIKYRWQFGTGPYPYRRFRGIFWGTFLSGWGLCLLFAFLCG